MSVNDQQLRAIAFLVAACRPAGCKPWDESGIYANLTKIRDRSLGAVIIAAVQAAEDRNAATPGVIPTAGPHWRDPAAAPSPRQTEPAGSACVTCGEFEIVCRARWKTDHEFVATERTRGEPSDEVRERNHRVVEALKGEIVPTAPPPEHKGLDAFLPAERDPRATAAREAMNAEITPAADREQTHETTGADA